MVQLLLVGHHAARACLAVRGILLLLLARHITAAWVPVLQAGVLLLLVWGEWWQLV